MLRCRAEERETSASRQSVPKPQPADFRVGVPGRIRTCDPEIRNLVLYPAELRGPSPSMPDPGTGRNGEPPGAYSVLDGRTAEPSA